MAIGTDTEGFVERIRALLPPWFPNPTSAPPFVTGLIAGYATVAAFIYSLLAYIRLQTRIATATDGWLDLIAYDFFGLRIQRNGATDRAFAQTIVFEVLRARNTRAAMLSILEQLTGRTPLIFVPNGGDPTGYLNATVYYGVIGGSPSGDTLAIDSAGDGLVIDAGGDILAVDTGYGPTSYGSRTIPFQVFITAYRGNGASDAQIYAAVESVKTAGIRAWVQIQN